jgi:hypothetical protein
MKRNILLALALAALAAPVATAAARPAVPSPVQRIIAQESRGGHVSIQAQNRKPSPVERIIAQEQARRNDPALLGQGATVQIVEPVGFHWADAGIGAAVTLALDN